MTQNEWLNQVNQFFDQNFEYQGIVEKKEEREITLANWSANVEEETREELEDNVADERCYLGCDHGDT